MENEIVIVINPGSTSTKIALYDSEKAIITENLEHSQDELEQFKNVIDQLPMREKKIHQFIDSHLTKRMKVKAIVGRGGPLKPLKGGTYIVNKTMINDLISCKYADHPSNLGAILANKLSINYNVPAFVVDPVTVDEFIPEARISGISGIERKSRSHALNIRATVREAAKKLKKDYQNFNCVVAHLGGGISICAVRNGKLIDVNNGLLGQGPFSPNRAGALPIGDLVEMCFKTNTDKNEILKLLSKESGLFSYLGTSSVQEVLHHSFVIKEKKALLIYRAMIYQIAKEIGAMAVAVNYGILDAIILTGGMTNSEKIIEDVSSYISFLAKNVLTFPGEREMSSLAKGAFRVLKGKEKALKY